MIHRSGLILSGQRTGLRRGTAYDIIRYIRFVGGFLRVHRFVATFALFVLPFASSLLAQGSPEPIPGVSFPNGNTPWAVDLYDGEQQIVPIHHTEVGVNNHKAANVADSLAGKRFLQAESDNRNRRRARPASLSTPISLSSTFT